MIAERQSRRSGPDQTGLRFQCESRESLQRSADFVNGVFVREPDFLRARQTIQYTLHFLARQAAPGDPLEVLQIQQRELRFDRNPESLTRLSYMRGEGLIRATGVHILPVDGILGVVIVRETGHVRPPSENQKQRIHIVAKIFCNMYWAASRRAPPPASEEFSGDDELVDVAREMIGDREIELKIIGSRPGEKLHEVLISGEETVRTLRRESNYVIKPILPELRDDTVTGNVLDGEFSSGDVVMPRADVGELLKANGLLPDDKV